MTEADKSPEDMSLEELRKLVAQLSIKFKRAVVLGTAAVAVLGVLGYGKLADIESKAREKVDATITKGTEYFDLIINGQTRIQAYQWSAAIPYFEKARTLRPDDEFTLYSLLQCYASNAELDAGIRLVEDSEKAGLFSRRFNEIWTLLNAGRIYTLASVDKPELSAKADYYLGRAQRAAEIQKGGDLSYVLYAKAVLEYTRSNKVGWTQLLVNLVEIDPRARDWPTGDRPEPWFQLLLKRYPQLFEDFNNTLRGSAGG